MDQLILSLNVSAAIATFIYIVFLLTRVGDESEVVAANYFNMKRSLLNQNILRRRA